MENHTVVHLPSRLQCHLILSELEMELFKAIGSVQMIQIVSSD